MLFARFATRTVLLAIGLSSSALTSTAHAQVRLAWQYESPVATLGDVSVTDLEITSNGTSYLSGIVSFGHATPEGLSLTSLDAGGNVQWSRHFLRNALDPAFVAVSAFDGGVVQAAPFYHFGTGLYRVQIVKYDAAGTLAWSAVLTDVDAYTDIREEKTFLDVDALGNIYVGGSARVAPNQYAPRITSFDSAGNVRFTADLSLTGVPTNLPQTVDILDVDPLSGDVFFAGHAGYSVAAGFSTYTARLTPAGVVSWVSQTPNSPGSYTWITALGVDAQGRVSTLQQVSSSEGYTGTTLVRLTRLDAVGGPAGSIVYSWAVTRPYSLSVSAEGHVAVAGNTSGANFPAYVTRYDAALNPLWTNSLAIPGTYNSNFNMVSLAPDGDVTVAGLRNRQTFSGFDAGIACVRYDAAGNQRWVHEGLATNELGDYVIAQAVDASGRVWLAVREFPPTAPGALKQIVRQLEPQSHSFCHGDGASVACPCGNSSGPLEQAGCTNSSGTAGKLVDGGVASLANDTLTFTTTGMNPIAPALLVQGAIAIQPVPFGDGLRCFGGALQRLYVATAAGGAVSVPGVGGPSVSTRSAALGSALTAGQRRAYQTYYRDGDLSFCAAGGTFNFSNALLVSWAP